MTETTCSCPEFGRTSRRGFLKGAAGVAGAAVLTRTVGDAFTQVSFGATTSPNVLVVLSMRGGADGLSLVVPHADLGYALARPTIAVPTSALLAKDASFGLHPGLQPLLPMWDAGTFGAVHAVGLPQPNRSHFTAMEQVEDADPGSPERRGWINRMIGQIGASAPQDAVQLGSGVVDPQLDDPLREPAVDGAPAWLAADPRATRPAAPDAAVQREMEEDLGGDTDRAFVRLAAGEGDPVIEPRV